MELIKSSDSDYEEYENLLLERDQADKRAGQIWTSYLCTFGELIVEVYEEQIACIECRKTISFYQQALNHGEPIDSQALRKYLSEEMSSYYENLQSLQEDTESCLNSRRSTAREVHQSKILYRRMAKLLHPDINPETGHNEKLMELWNRIVTAYHHNDSRALSELEVLVNRALADLGLGEIKVEIPDIRDRIEELKKEIDRIKHTEPYIYGEILDSDEAVRKKTRELEAELETYQKYHLELEEEIQNMLTSGGVKITWQTN